MDGFKEIFESAQQEYANSENQMESFRHANHIYGFCTNGDNEDKQSLNYAITINKYLFHSFTQQLKSLVGYKGNEDKYLPISDVDAKHILMLTFLFNNNDLSYDRIVEIGGGFGNMGRLTNNIIKYNHWDIIDIPHMLELQKFYLEHEIKDISKFNFINGFTDFAYENKSIDLVIATHSLSEFSWDIFIKYFHNVITKSKYLYFGYNKMCPSPQLVYMKLEYIKTHGFVLEKYFDFTENSSGYDNGAMVSYDLYKNVLSV
jgi:hypothetical protein